MVVLDFLKSDFNGGIIMYDYGNEISELIANGWSFKMFRRVK